MQSIDNKLSLLHQSVDDLIRKLNKLQSDNELLKKENDSFRAEIKGLKEESSQNKFAKDIASEKAPQDEQLREEIKSCIEEIDRCIEIIEKREEA